MANDTKTTGAAKPKDVAGRLIVKLLMPLVATAASAAAGYAAKKAPELLDGRVGPRLRGAKDEAAKSVGDLPGRAKSAAGSAGDLASGLADRARAVAGGALPWGDDDEAGETSGTNGGAPERSNEELTRRRAERAGRRDDRRRNSSRT
jgi:hypothetical protein